MSFSWGWEQSIPLVAAQTSPDSWAAVLLVSDTRMKWISKDILRYDDEARYIVFDVKKSLYLGQHHATLWEWLRKANGEKSRPPPATRPVPSGRP